MNAYRYMCFYEGIKKLMYVYIERRTYANISLSLYIYILMCKSLMTYDKNDNQKI